MPEPPEPEPAEPKPEPETPPPPPSDDEEQTLADEDHDEPEEPPSPTGQRWYTVQGEIVPIFAEPSLHSEELGTLAAGLTVEGSEEQTADGLMIRACDEQGEYFVPFCNESGKPNLRLGFADEETGEWCAHNHPPTELVLT